MAETQVWKDWAGHDLHNLYNRNRHSGDTNNTSDGISMKTYTSNTRRKIGGIWYYWHGWASSTDYAVNRAHSPNIAISIGEESHLYGGRVAHHGWHIWKCAKKHSQKGFVIKDIS